LTESLNGLRFDIYERVHLSEDVAAIEELEEIELIPHMQAVSSEDQIVLKGHLLLTGTYRSTDEQEAARRLEHWIPVEISLPPNRIEKLEDLAVEIDNGWSIGFRSRFPCRRTESRSWRISPSRLTISTSTCSPPGRST